MSPKLKEDTINQRRNQIYVAASQCFAEKGFYQTSVEDIVVKAGISKGALYTYFPSKDALFCDMMEDYRDAVHGELVEELSKMHSATDQLKHFFDCQRQESSWDIQLAVEFWLYSRYNTVAREMNLERYDLLIGFLTDVIRKGQENGEFSDKIDPHRLSAMIWGYLDGIKLRWLVLQDNEGYLLDLDNIEKNFWEMVKK